MIFSQNIYHVTCRVLIVQYSSFHYVILKVVKKHITKEKERGETWYLSIASLLPIYIKLLSQDKVLRLFVIRNSFARWVQERADPVIFASDEHLIYRIYYGNTRMTMEQVLLWFHFRVAQHLSRIFYFLPIKNLRNFFNLLLFQRKKKKISAKTNLVWSAIYKRFDQLLIRTDFSSDNGIIW